MVALVAACPALVLASPAFVVAVVALVCAALADWAASVALVVAVEALVAAAVAAFAGARLSGPTTRTEWTMKDPAVMPWSKSNRSPVTVDPSQSAAPVAVGISNTSCVRLFSGGSIAVAAL